MRKLSKRGFTLIEVLVGAIIIAGVSLAGWVSVTVLTKSGEISRNRSMAVNLLQQSQEELRRIAQVDTTYDTLNTCQFPNPVAPPTNTCGLADTTTTFPGFVRTMAVTFENGSTELKRVLTTVQWQEDGIPKQIQSIVLLSRPPDPLPGNIIGFVSSETQAATPLGSIPISIDFVSSTASYSTTSAAVADGRGANFDFAEVGTGRFVLPTGNYNLTVNASGYFPYTHPVEITVPSNGEVFVAVQLRPLPTDAVISGNVIDLSTGSPISSFSGARIRRYEGGSYRQQTVNQRSYSFTIPFSDSNPQSFTINTLDAFRAGFVYQTNSGGSPSCNFDYTREGFSSAVVQADSSLVCSNPHNGSSASDRVTVFPGDNITLDLPVLPVPEVQIFGRVLDSDNNPVSGATIRARWPRSDGSYDWRKQGVLQTATSDINGNFTFNVPAVQGMFPGSNPSQNYLQVWARGQVNVIRCCDVQQNVWRNSPTAYVGILNPLDPPRDIGVLRISSTDENCGNVGGDITDGLTSNAIDTANVQISVTELTDGTGHYDIECAPAQTGFRLRTNRYRFIASKAGYYTNDSNGNAQYRRRGSGGRDVQIQTDTTINYDAELWPRGFGDIQVNVVDKTTGVPMDGVDVRLSPYTGSSSTLTTAGGTVTFVNVAETWPTPAVPNNGYYNMNSQSHRIDINHDPANYLPHTEIIPNLDDGTVVTITIMLERIGGV